MKGDVYLAPNGAVVSPCPVASNWGKHAYDRETGFIRCTAHGDRCPALTRPQGHLEQERSKSPSRRRHVEQSQPDDEPVLSSLTKAAPVPDPTILRLPDGTRLFRKGWVHWIHGKGGSGKTPLAYLAANEVIAAGGYVLLVDHEMGDAGALDLLRDLAPELSDEEIDAHVRYMYEKPLHSEQTRLKLISELDGFTPDLVIVDAVTGSMAEGSQNDNADVNRWFRAVAQWLRDQFGAAVLVIDHSNRDDGPMPSGSARKHGAPEFRLWVRLVRDFNPNHEDGCSLLEVRKERGRHARTGKVVAELRTVKGGSFMLREVGKSPTSSSDEIDVAIPDSALYEQEHLDALTASRSEPLTRTDLVGDGGGINKARREALDRLVKRGRVIERKMPGSARGRLYWLAEFFPGGPDE